MTAYGSRSLDLIIAVMGPAVTFLLQHGDDFAPGVPIVFCGADAADLEGTTLPAHVTGLLVRRSFAPTVDLALRLQPDTRQVFVVGGSSEFDRHLQATARRDFEPFERRASFTYLTDLPMRDLLTAVSNVPPRSVVADDGVGFVVGRLGHKGLGLMSISERVDAMNGSLSVSSSPHRGTRLTVSFPVNSAELEHHTV